MLGDAADGGRDTAADGLSLLTPGEVASLLGVGPAAVRRHVRDGGLVAFRLGDGPKARYRIPSWSVAEFLRDNARGRVEVR